MAAETRRGSVPARLPLLPAWVCCPGHPALVRSLRHLPVVPALGPVQEKVQAVCTAAFRALCVLPAMHTQLAGVSALWLDVGSGQGAGCLGARVPCWRQRSGGIRGQFSRGSQRPLGGGAEFAGGNPTAGRGKGQSGWARVEPALGKGRESVRGALLGSAGHGSRPAVPRCAVHRSKSPVHLPPAGQGTRPGSRLSCGGRGLESAGAGPEGSNAHAQSLPAWAVQR